MICVYPCAIAGARRRERERNPCPHKRGRTPTRVELADDVGHPSVVHAMAAVFP